jgi:hypothetical protein
LDDIRDFFVARCLAVAGYDEGVSVPAESARRPRASRKAA